MAVVHVRRRRRGLGDLSEDMHNAAMNAPTVTDLPSHAPYLAAYHYAGQTFINMNNPADSGGDDTANWVGYTGAFYGVSEQQKTYYWGGQGAEVQIPGWTAEMAVKDPAGYQAALAQWRQQNAGAITAITTQIQTTQATERAATNAENTTTNAKQILAAWLEHRTFMLNHGSTYAEAPQYPPEWFTGPLDEATKAELRRLVAGLPPDPVVKPATGGTQTVTPTTGGSTSGGTTGGTAGGTTSIPVYTAPGYSGGAGGGTHTTSPDDNDFADANGGGMGTPTPGGGAPFGGGSSGGGAAAGASGGLLSSPLALGAAAVLGFMLLRKRS